MRNFRGTWTFTKKESQRFTSVWSQTILSPIVSNLLFLLIFGALFVGRESPFLEVPYLTFLIPGLAAMGLITNAFQNASSSLVLSKYTGDITDMLMLPLSGFELAVAHTLPAIFRGCLVSVVTVIVGAFFTPMFLFSIPLILLSTILIGTIFGALGIIIGVVSKTFDQMAVVSSFIIQPLIFLGGVFYSIESLPGVFGILSKFNPMLYLIDLYRFGFIGKGDTHILLSLGITTLVACISFLIAWRILSTGYKLKT